MKSKEQYQSERSAMINETIAMRDELNKKDRELRNHRSEYLTQLMENSDLKDWPKVRLTYKLKDILLSTECYIGEYTLNTRDDLKFIYHKCKNDGSMSQRLLFNSWDSPEIISIEKVALTPSAKI